MIRKIRCLTFRFHFDFNSFIPINEFWHFKLKLFKISDKIVIPAPSSIFSWKRMVHKFYSEVPVPCPPLFSIFKFEKPSIPRNVFYFWQRSINDSRIGYFPRWYCKVHQYSCMNAIKSVWVLLWAGCDHFLLITKHLTTSQTCNGATFFELWNFWLDIPCFLLVAWWVDGAFW